jgi:hypothetical protein
MADTRIPPINFAAHHFRLLPEVAGFLPVASGSGRISDKCLQFTVGNFQRWLQIFADYQKVES